MIPPPFRLDLLVISAMAKDVPMRETHRRVIPFRISDRARIVLLVPWRSPWLPGPR